jgi:hypothetical protein
MEMVTTLASASAWGKLEAWMREDVPAADRNVLGRR